MRDSLEHLPILSREIYHNCTPTWQDWYTRIIETFIHILALYFQNIYVLDHSEQTPIISILGIPNFVFITRMLDEDVTKSGSIHDSF